MNIQEAWEKALKMTEITRPRVQPLQIHEVTRLPYVFVAESAVNMGNTVVRRGEVMVEKPAIVLPSNMPQFEGFDFEEGMRVNEEFLKTFFMVRGVTFHSLKYNNVSGTLDVFEGRLSKAIGHYRAVLQQGEDVHTGLVAGSEDCWQFAVLIFVCTQVSRSAESDLRRLMDDYRHRGLLS